MTHALFIYMKYFPNETNFRVWLHGVLHFRIGFGFKQMSNWRHVGKMLKLRREGKAFQVKKVIALVACSGKGNVFINEQKMTMSLKSRCAEYDKAIYL